MQRHNYAFASTVLKYLIDHSSTNIIRMKSDNCATQYKSKYDFMEPLVKGKA